MRLDGGFAAAEVFDCLEREGLEYVVAMGGNKVLKRRAARLMGTAQRLSRESGETEHLYSEIRYAAGAWDHLRRVIIKAEVARRPGRKPKNNPRFVVTNFKQSPQHLYEVIFCARANVENRIKELHHGLEIDRTSCTRFLANQLRGLLTTAAYVLYQELCLSAARIALPGLHRARSSLTRAARAELPWPKFLDCATARGKTASFAQLECQYHRRPSTSRPSIAILERRNTRITAFVHVG